MNKTIYNNMRVINQIILQSSKSISTCWIINDSTILLVLCICFKFLTNQMNISNMIWAHELIRATRFSGLRNKAAQSAIKGKLNKIKPIRTTIATNGILLSSGSQPCFIAIRTIRNETISPSILIRSKITSKKNQELKTAHHYKLVISINDRIGNKYSFFR